MIHKILIPSNCIPPGLPKTPVSGQKATADGGMVCEYDETLQRWMRHYEHKAGAAIRSLGR